MDVNSTEFSDQGLAFKEKAFLGAALLLGVCSLVFFLYFRTLAFPEYAINFGISKQEAAGKAATFLGDLGYKLDAYNRATIFGSDAGGLRYLEREIGAQEAGRLGNSGIDLWHFSTRFFIPGNEEEFEAEFLPNGRFAGFSHTVEEAKALPSLSKDDAQNLAEAFLTANVGVRISDWKLISAYSEDRTHRTDHSFTWEKVDFKAKDATYRMGVGILGNEVGSYGEYLKIPEAWWRNYIKETSRNDLAQMIAEIFSFLFFGVSLLFVFIVQFRKRNLRLRFAAWVGGFAAIIQFLAFLNSLPIYIYHYSTTQSWVNFIGGAVFGGLMASIALGLSVLVIVASGEAIYRETFGEKLGLENIFTFRGLRTKMSCKAAFVGSCVGIILFAYQLGYYLLGKKFGFWTPAAINYNDALGTFIPWVYPLLLGFSAAVLEEGTYRLFGISFAKKYLKHSWLAVLLTSLVWAFMHSNYPQTPWFARGIEISFVGIVLGILFLRYGIFASLAAHFTFNSLQLAIFFYTAGGLYAGISSTAVSLLPFLFSIAALLIARKKGFVSEARLGNRELSENISLQNKKEIPIIDLPVASSSDVYRGLSKKTIAYLAAGTLLALPVIYFLSLPFDLKTGPYILNRGEILAAASDNLRSRNVPVDSYQTVVTKNTPAVYSTDAAYILSHGTFTTLQYAYSRNLYPDTWHVRFFKPLQQEEYSVDTLPNGDTYRISHTVDEKAPGANLSLDKAIISAKEYLVTRGYDIGNYTLIEKSSVKRDARTDYTFVFEDNSNGIGEAKFRTTVGLIGSEPSGFYQYLKIPEAWLRDREKQGLKDLIAQIVFGILGLCVALYTIVTFLRFVRNKKIGFKVAALFGAAAVVVAMLDIANKIPTLYAYYSTSIPSRTFLLEFFGGNLVSAVSNFLITMIVVGFFVALWREHIGPILPAAITERRIYLRDAIVAGYATPFILIAILGPAIIFLALQWRWLPSSMLSTADLGLDQALPVFSILKEGLMAMIAMMAIGIFAILSFRILKRWLWVVAAVAALIVLGVFAENNIHDALPTLFYDLISLAAIGLFVFFIARKNLFAYGLIMFVIAIVDKTWGLLSAPNVFFRTNGIVAVLILILPILCIVLWRKRFAENP